MNTVIDKKMIEKITACVASDSQYALPTKANHPTRPTHERGAEDVGHARQARARVRPPPARAEADRPRRADR